MPDPTDKTDQKVRSLREHAAHILGQEETPPNRRGGDGGGDGGSMERVTRLETHMEYVRRDLDDIRSSLAILPSLATKADLNTWRWQWIATGAAIVATILGGMAYLGDMFDVRHSASSSTPSSTVSHPGGQIGPKL